jgi:outer membrane protein OmpA-like peptidoglycan-associated protein
MIQKFIILFFVFCISVFTELNAQYGDCGNMLILKDTIYQAQSISGFGNTNEFEGNELEDIKTFEEEKNSIWYFITAPSDGVFTFDIISENEGDDWDFLLFEYKKKFCTRIKDNKIVPIRTNLSRSPITGMSRKGKENFVGAGVNNTYSRPTHVNKGDRYVLVVNNPKRAKGNHTLVLHFPQEKKTLGANQNKETPAEVVQTKFELIVKDKGTENLVKSNISIIGIGSKPLVMADKSVFIKYITKKTRTLSINASAKGYMLTSLECKITKNQLTVSYDVLLEPIKSGAKVNLKNIQFYGNRFDLLPSARPTLDALLLFMKINPTVSIEVEGHVNGPRQKNSKEYQELSYSRAYAVKEFLMKKGVNKERLDFKGYGNSRMLYPDPKNSYQEAANRRVEIKILSK